MSQVLPNRNPIEEYMARLAMDIAAWLPGYGVGAGTIATTSFKLLGEDGRGLTFWAGAVHMDSLAEIRLKVSGIYDLNAYVRDEDKPCITVGVKKGPRAIAKDVQRRFLPKYEAIYAKALETHNEIKRTNEARERLMADLAGAFGFKEVRDKDNHLGHLVRNRVFNEKTQRFVDSFKGKITASLRIAPESRYQLYDHEKSKRQWEVDIELEGLTVDQAFRIAEALKGPAFPPEQLSLL